MVKVSRVLLRDAGIGISKTLSDILVCPLSKQPLRVCEETGSLISDAIAVSFPVDPIGHCYNQYATNWIVDGIPCLVPEDGKLLETDDTLKPDSAADSSVMNKEDGGGNP